MKLLRTMTLKVSLFAGVKVDDAARDLCELAGRIGVLCEADFNGVKLWARPGDDPEKLVAEWSVQMARPANLCLIALAPQ